MPIVALDYIEVDDRGVAKLVGTRLKVMQIVMDVQNGLSPEGIHQEYPHLSVAQIHAALAYYYDHKNAVDDQITESRRFAEEMRSKHPNRFTRAELEDRWRERYGTEPPGRGGVMPVRFYMDQHVPRAITNGLRRRGVDVLRVQDDGHDRADDDVILDRAGVLGRVVYTRDDDFLVEVHKRPVAGIPFAGVVYSHQQGPSIGVCIHDLEIIAGASEMAEMANKLEYLPL